MPSKEPAKPLLLDADVYFSYIRGDALSPHAANVVASIKRGEIEPCVSSILFDDMVTALRSKQVDKEDIRSALLAVASIGCTPLPITPAIALTSLDLIEIHGGSRRLHYFDAYHVATAIHGSLPILTSDKYILENQAGLEVTALDLRKM
jgi:predicted nucleic acid-binding protein